MSDAKAGRSFPSNGGAVVATFQFAFGVERCFCYFKKKSVKANELSLGYDESITITAAEEIVTSPDPEILVKSRKSRACSDSKL